MKQFATPTGFSFSSTDSATPVNLDSHLFTKINENKDSPDIDANMFDKAAQHIASMMSDDSLMKFKQSEFYGAEAKSTSEVSQDNSEQPSQSSRFSLKSALAAAKPVMDGATNLVKTFGRAVSSFLTGPATSETSPKTPRVASTVEGQIKANQGNPKDSISELQAKRKDLSGMLSKIQKGIKADDIITNPAKYQGAADAIGHIKSSIKQIDGLLKTKTEEMKQKESSNHTADAAIKAGGPSVTHAHDAAWQQVKSQKQQQETPKVEKPTIAAHRPKNK